MFSSCGTFDMIVGFSLIFLAFLLSIFQIQAYTALSTDKQKNYHMQYAVAIITLVVTILYFLYMIKDPVLSIFNSARKRISK